MITHNRSSRPIKLHTTTIFNNFSQPITLDEYSIRVTFIETYRMSFNDFSTEGN